MYKKLTSLILDFSHILHSIFQFLNSENTMQLYKAHYFGKVYGSILLYSILFGSNSLYSLLSLYYTVKTALSLYRLE